MREIKKERNKMKKTLIGMMGVAVVLSSAMAQENDKQEQQVQSQEEVSQNVSYAELIEQQMQERSQAFNNENIQKDDKALAQMIERQRNRILEWEKQQSRTR